MMLRAVFLVATVAAPAAFAAGLWQGQTHKEAVAVTGARVNAPLVAKPGHGVADAGRYFAALNAPPPPPPPMPKAAPPPPPPPPDVAVLFRRELSAVIREPQPRLVLAGSRSLRPGDVYRDGWVLSNITPTTAVLTKGKEQRQIGLFSPPPASQVQVATAAAPPSLAPTLTFSNGAPRGRPSAVQVAGVTSALRAAGMNQQQTDRISQMMASGTFDQGAASQMLNQMGRNTPMTAAQVANITQAMQRAGTLQPGQAQALTQSIPQMQNMQQLQQVMQMGGQNNNRGGGGGRNRNQGFNAPAGASINTIPPPAPPAPPTPAGVNGGFGRVTPAPAR